MTVCIGALCANEDGEKAKVAVVASDRMVTLAGLTEFEHEVPKIQQINDHLVALIAGDALRGSRVVRSAAINVPGGMIATSDVAGLIAREYAQHRQEQLNSDVFQPRAMTIDQFYNGGVQQRLIPQVAGQIDMVVAGFDFEVQLLVAGLDDNGAHLYSIANPGGSFNDHMPIGYHAIGSGWLHALQSMISFGHTSARGLLETIYTVYASKRRAEVAPGVGRDTDMMVVSAKEGLRRISEEELLKLEAFYSEQLQPIAELREKVGRLGLFKEGGTNDTN